MGLRHQSSPELSALPEGSVDPELLSLPRPPRQERTVSLVLMAVTAALALVMTWALLGDVRYAFRGAEPIDVGDLSHFVPTEGTTNQFVRGTGRLNEAGAVRYERALERDAFRLAPLTGTDRIWIEMRVPEGVGQVAAPTSFVGRLLPIRGFAFRYRGLRHSVEQASGTPVRDDAWVLVDGAPPASSQWAAAVAALFTAFAAYNLLTITRILRRVRR